MKANTKHLLRRLGCSLIILLTSGCLCWWALPGIVTKVSVQNSLSDLKTAQILWESQHLSNYSMMGTFRWSSLELVVRFTVRNNRVVKTEGVNLKDAVPESLAVKSNWYA